MAYLTVAVRTVRHHATRPDVPPSMDTDRHISVTAVPRPGDEISAFFLGHRRHFRVTRTIHFDDMNPVCIASEVVMPEAPALDLRPPPGADD